MATKTKEKPVTMLDRMKSIEEKKKRATIVKVMNKLKEHARHVQEQKELCEILLKEVASDEKERKQIIDWVNSLSDVQVDEDRKKELKEAVAEDLKEEKERVEKKMNEEPEKFMSDLSLYRDLSNKDRAFYSASNTTGSINYCARQPLHFASMSLDNSREGIKMMDNSAGLPA